MTVSKVKRDRLWSHKIINFSAPIFLLFVIGHQVELIVLMKFSTRVQFSFENFLLDHYKEIRIGWKTSDFLEIDKRSLHQN